MNTEDFVTYEQAIKLIELGFNWECIAYYDFFDKEIIPVTIPRILDSIRRIYAPTLAQVTKWLRDKHNLHIQIELVIGKRWTYTLVDMVPQTAAFGEYYKHIPRCREDVRLIAATYEDALSVGIDTALGLVKGKL